MERKLQFSDKHPLLTLIKELIEWYKEKRDYKKAIDTLTKQEWSVEFLQMLLSKCTVSTEITVTNVMKETFVIRRTGVVNEPKVPTKQEIFKQYMGYGVAQ